jgi:SPP1 gp7 family putative phage head morphogenesis protein
MTSRLLTPIPGIPERSLGSELDSLIRNVAVTHGRIERATLVQITAQVEATEEALRGRLSTAEFMGQGATLSARKLRRAIVQTEELLGQLRVDLEREAVAGMEAAAQARADAIGQAVGATYDRVADGAGLGTKLRYDASLWRLSPTQIEAATRSPAFGWQIHDWTQWHTEQAAQRIDRELRAAYFAGEGIEEVSRRVGRIMGGTTQQAAVTVRTAMQTASNTAAHELYRRNEDVLEGEQIIGTLDRRTCPECGQLDGRILKLRDTKARRPPFHPQCRCFLAPVIGGDLARLIGEQPPVPTWSDWIKRQSAETQREVLGATATRLARAGEIDFDDVVTASGRQRTGRELTELAQARRERRAA